MREKFGRSTPSHYKQQPQNLNQSAMCVVATPFKYVEGGPGLVNPPGGSVYFLFCPYVWGGPAAQRIKMRSSFIVHNKKQQDYQSAKAKASTPRPSRKRKKEPTRQKEAAGLPKHKAKAPTSCSHPPPLGPPHPHNPTRLSRSHQTLRLPKKKPKPKPRHGLRIRHSRRPRKLQSPQTPPRKQIEAPI